MTQTTIVQKSENFEERRCIHCGALSSEEFYCQGCRLIHSAIKSFGLERFYDLSSIPLGPSFPNTPSDKNFEEFDNDTVIKRICVQGDGASLIAKIPVSGIYCAGCVWLLDSLPRVSKFILRSKLDLSKGEVLVEYLPSKIPLSYIASILNSFGYPPLFVWGKERS